MANIKSKIAKKAAKILGIGKKKKARVGGKAKPPLTKKQKAIVKSRAIAKNVEAKRVRIKEAESLGLPNEVEVKLSREIKEGGRSEQVNVGKGVGGIDVGRFNPRELVGGSAKQRAAQRRVSTIESKGKDATKEEKDFVKEYNKFYADRETAAITKRAISRSASARKPKPADDFSDALNSAKETGEITAAYERLTPNQQGKIDRSVAVFQALEGDKVARRKVTARLREQAKSRTGSMDYRKGGLILSSVDNRKKKGK